MRIIESESKQGAYIIVILGLITAYFGFYIVTGVLVVLLFIWLFLCSSKKINPTAPNAIVAPISGVIKHVVEHSDSVEFHIKARYNGRVYAPSDLYDIKVQKYHGFYFLRENALTKALGAKDTLEAQTTLENENLSIRIEVLPRILRFCGLYTGKLQSLFLEKIGFLNVGTLRITISGTNLKVLAKQGEHLLGGSSPLVTIQEESHH